MVHHLQVAPRKPARSERRAVNTASSGIRLGIVPCQLWWLYDTRYRNRLANLRWWFSNYDHKHENRKTDCSPAANIFNADHKCRPRQWNNRYYHFTQSTACVHSKSFFSFFSYSTSSAPSIHYCTRLTSSTLISTLFFPLLFSLLLLSAFSLLLFP